MLDLTQLLTFDSVQQNFYDLKFVLNADKTKVMLFSNTKSKPLDFYSSYSRTGKKAKTEGGFGQII